MTKDALLFIIQQRNYGRYSSSTIYVNDELISQTTDITVQGTMDVQLHIVFVKANDVIRYISVQELSTQFIFVS